MVGVEIKVAFGSSSIILKRDQNGNERIEFQNFYSTYFTVDNPDASELLTALAGALSAMGREVVTYKVVQVPVAATP